MSYREEVDLIVKGREFVEADHPRDPDGKFIETGAVSGARFRKPWPLGHMFTEHRNRTEPGSGIDAKDDGVPGDTKVKMRSIAHVSTPRLERRRDYLIAQLRTPEGLHAWDDTRRALIEANMHLKAIEWELERRANVRKSVRTEVAIVKRGKSLARAAAASKQLRWPEGVDVAPGGKGPGGGRFRAGSAKRAAAAMERNGKSVVDVARKPKTAPKAKAPAATKARAVLPTRAGSIATDSKNPYFRALFRPIKAKKTTSDFATFRAHHHARTSSAGVIEAGGKTHFRRFIPVGWKPGQTIKPPDAEGRGKYVAGEGMSLNEVGDMGEALAYYNPTIRGYIEKYYGGKMSEPEGFNMANGRAANSLFDAYVGQYGVEIKTLAVTGNRDKYKLPDFSEKLKLAKSKGIKPGYMFLMVDQQHGKVWLFATPKTKTLTASNNNQSYSQMDMLTPAEGLDVGQDMMYAAWLYGSLARPIREGGDGNSVKGAKGKVVITGKPSKTRWGSGTKTAGSDTVAGAEALLHGNQWTGKFR